MSEPIGRRPVLRGVCSLLGATILPACGRTGERAKPHRNVCAAISEELAAGNPVKLEPGATYVLCSPIVLVAGARLTGDDLDPPILVPGPDFEADSADPDESANALIVGRSTASFQTTLSSISRKDELTLVVDDPSGISPNDWVRVAGNNVGGDLPGASDGVDVIKREVARVLGVNGSILSLESPLLQQHAAGSTVEVIEALADVVVTGLKLDAAGSTVACGLTLEDSVRAQLAVGVRGFSRAGVNLTGSRDATVHAEGLGACNAVVLLDSVGDTAVRVTALSGAERTHHSGVPRGLVTLRHRCVGITIEDSILEGGCTGISVWGGTTVTIRNCAIRDMRLHERAERDPAIPRDLSGQALSAPGIEVGAFLSPSAEGEFGFGLAIQNVVLENCRHPSPDFQSSVLIVDQHGFSLSSISIVNVGYHASTPSEYMGGLTLYDTFDGLVDDITLRGVTRPLHFAGNWLRCDIGSVQVQLTDGLGDNYTPIITLSCGNSFLQPSKIRVERLTGSSTSSLLEATGNFIPSTASTLTIEKLSLDLHDYEDVIVASNESGTAFNTGDIAELATGAGGAVGAIDPTSPDPENKVVVVNGKGLGFNPGTGWLLVSRGPKRAARVRIIDEVAPGDSLAAVAGKRELAVDPEGGPGVGTALAARPAGSAFLVPMG